MEYHQGLGGHAWRTTSMSAVNISFRAWTPV